MPRLWGHFVEQISVVEVIGSVLFAILMNDEVLIIIKQNDFRLVTSSTNEAPISVK